MKQLAARKRPIALTIQGRTALVVMTATHHQELLDRIDRVECLAGLRQGLADVQAGRTEPIETVLDRLKSKDASPNRRQRRPQTR